MNMDFFIVMIYRKHNTGPVEYLPCSVQIYGVDKSNCMTDHGQESQFCPLADSQTNGQPAGKISKARDWQIKKLNNT